MSEPSWDKSSMLFPSPLVKYPSGGGGKDVCAYIPTQTSEED